MTGRSSSGNPRLQTGYSPEVPSSKTQTPSKVSNQEIFKESTAIFLILMFWFATFEFPWDLEFGV
jgi:hypothetical protein